MDVFDTQYFRVNKLMLSFVGLWPIQTSSSKSIFLYYAILGSLIILLLPQIAFLFKHLTNLNDLNDVLPTTIGTSLCFFKAIGFHWQTEDFRVLIEHVRHDWCILAEESDIWILKEYVEKNRMFTLAFLSIPITIIFTYGGAASFVTAPLTIPILDIILASNVTRPKRMPHPTEFFLDLEKYYYTLLTTIFVGYAACTTVVIATDTMYFALLQHTCGTLAILSSRLEKLAVYDKSKSLDRNPVFEEDKNAKNIIQCVQLQIRIERLIHLIDSTFAKCLFIDIGLGILIQCSACVMIVTHTEIIRNGPILFLESVRLFFNSWLGQRLMDHSSQISVAAYNGSWYQTSLEAKKMLLFLIMKCQKPCRITIAKLYVICMESYSTLMRSSASYITLMVSLSSDE